MLGKILTEILGFAVGVVVDMIYIIAVLSIFGEQNADKLCSTFVQCIIIIAVDGSFVSWFEKRGK